MDGLRDHRIDFIVDEFGVRVLIVDPGGLSRTVFAGKQLIQVDLQGALGEVDFDHFVLRGDRLRQDLLEDLFLHIRLDDAFERSAHRQCRKQLGEIEQLLRLGFDRPVDLADRVVDHAGGLFDYRGFHQQAGFGNPVLPGTADAVRVEKLAVFRGDFGAACTQKHIRLAERQVRQSVQAQLFEQCQKVDPGCTEVPFGSVQGQRTVRAGQAADRVRIAGARSLGFGKQGAHLPEVDQIGDRQGEASERNHLLAEDPDVERFPVRTGVGFARCLGKRAADQIFSSDAGVDHACGRLGRLIDVFVDVGNSWKAAGADCKRRDDANRNQPPQPSFRECSNFAATAVLTCVHQSSSKRI